MQSFVNLHIECKRALPDQMILYKHAILLQKMYNNQLPETEWIALNFQQILTFRQTTFSIVKTNKKELATTSYLIAYIF